MPRRLTIIQRHPDPVGSHLCHALADAYSAGAAVAGHEVMRVEIAHLEFPILRTQHDFEHGPVPESLVQAQDAMISAQHLAISFPLWHGTMPALLKAFIEQVMRPGVALKYRKHGFPKGLLAGRSARLVVTMGMPALIYRWYFRTHGVRGLERSVLRFAGMKPVHETLFGMVDAASAAKRGKWLDRMRDYGRRLVLRLPGHSSCPPVGSSIMSVEMALEIWKWRLSWTSSISGRSVGNDFSSLVEIRETAISTCPPFPPPTGDQPPLNVVGQPRPYGRKRTR
jgi:putative NADPH-quinone reductase